MRKSCVFIVVLFSLHFLSAQNFAPFKAKKKSKKEPKAEIIQMDESTRAQLGGKISALANEIQMLEKESLNPTLSQEMRDKKSNVLIEKRLETSQIAQKLKQSEQLLASASASEDDQPEILIPAGANIGIHSSDGSVESGESGNSTKAGAVIGFCVSRNDKYYFSFFINKSTESLLKGGQEVFGENILNPSTESLSIYFSGNIAGRDIMNLFKKKAKHLEESDSSIYLGLSGRFGCSIGKWLVSSDLESTPEKGSVLFLDINLMAATKSYSLETPKNNFQIGMEFGPSFRFLADIDKNFIERAEVIGKNQRLITGLTWTASVRLNFIRPYLKITYFRDLLNENGERYPVKGLTGVRAFIGVDVLTPFFNDVIQ